MAVYQNKNIDSIQAVELGRELHVTQMTAELLIARGYSTKESARAFLFPKLSDLPNFKDYSGVCNAINRIKNAIDLGEKIIVYGDYDCDGVCASAILSDSLKRLGADVSVYIPKRLEEGYGMSIDTLEKVAEEYFPDLIITVDCGISSKREVEYCLNELGIDVIITDHHEPPSELPECIVINPHLDETKGFFADFCGAGVAFMLVLALTDIEFVSRYFDVVAIATMGDIVSLTGANRVLVKYGVKKIMKAPCLGIKLLIESLGLKSDLTGYDLGFKIVPRINALGRLGDASRAIALFTEEDYFVLSCLVKEMNEENVTRQKICDDIEKEASESAKAYINTERALVLYGKWHKGVLGITASKLAERYHRPVILFCLENGILKGSCRSVPEINIYELLCKFDKYFVQYGGHAQAAGVTMEISQFEPFREAFLDYVRENYPADAFLPKYNYDLDITGKTVTREFLEELKGFEPFGHSNPKPVFLSVEKACSYQYGKNNPVHISQSTKLGYSVSGFYKGEYLPMLNSSAEKECLYSLSLNEFNGRIYSQAVLEKVIIKNFPYERDFAFEVEKYAKSSIFGQNEAQLFDKNEIYRIICDEFSENLYGNLVVCYTLDSYWEMAKLLFSENLRFESFYGVSTTKNTVNAVLYCPNEDFDFSTYANVYFIDKPLSFPEEGENNMFSIDRECSHFSYLKGLTLDRERVGNYYRKIRQIISNGRFKTVDLIWKATGYSDAEKVEFLLAWQILNEVQLIGFSPEKECFILKNIRTELTNSNLYCIINDNGRID